ncbi:hypothetical protein C1H46_044773 [Malus baccata]|uniref:Dicer-like 104 n=1 Tax=Malus baccata TaxID=106549 RepID=A0A540K650_MALBA|nr:hypothetical protein C1H46_044773 [Malus baccata]
MTASPIKSKGGNSESSYWKIIDELETLMNSKVYTCASESVLAEFIPHSTTKFKYYRHDEIPGGLVANIINQLNALKEKAAWFFSQKENELFSWGKLDVLGEKIVRNFSSEAYQAFASFLPSDRKWTIANDVTYDLDKGLLTSKVVCLIQLLHEYRGLKDLRCIVFVERVITAVVIESLFSTFFPKLNDWKTKYIAGNNSAVQFQTRKRQNEIVEEFRKGMVNIIVATSILEEGLDVQSCNLVIRFDPSSTVSSFIQSKGRARMQNSDYVLMLKSGDSSTHSRVQNYLASGAIMRKESLRHSSLACTPLEIDLQDDDFYRVESTGASLSLASSIGLMYFYCSRLPSDGYFKPAPRWDKETCTLHLPKSCPIPDVHVKGNVKILKQLACFEACKELHKIGALTDNLVPDIVEEEGTQELGSEPYDDVQCSYVPIELVKPFCSNDPSVLYHCYLIELNQNFEYDIPVHNIVLGMRSELDCDIANPHFDLEVGRGSVTVNFKYVGEIHLNSEQVLLCRRFQITIFQILIDHNLNKLGEVLDGLSSGGNVGIDYLLLPGTRIHQEAVIIDWRCVTSVLFASEEYSNDHVNCSTLNGCSRLVHTKQGLVCTCMIQNSLVCTPHNGTIYCITGLLSNLNGNSLLKLRDGRALTYKKYYEERIVLDHCTQNVIIPTVKVLEAITTKKCQENYHLESLEALGDSFLKYAASQQLFKTYQNNHEGLLSVKKEKIISNAALCRLGCDHKLPVIFLYSVAVSIFHHFIFVSCAESVKCPTSVGSKKPNGFK